VITDLAEADVSCSSLGTVGSSDHFAVLSKITLKAAREETLSRTIWQWEKADWQGMCDALSEAPWEDILAGTVDRQTNALTKLLMSLQTMYVPNKTYKTKSTDQPWFGNNCRVAAGEKMRAWNRYKRHPTQRNKDVHAMACRRMRATQKWAINRWKEDLRLKFTGRSVGSKAWWSSIKQQQGFAPDDRIPPLNKPDGSMATSSREKAELLASVSSEKMRVRDPDRPPPSLPPVTHSKLSSFVITEAEVRQLLNNVDVQKAIGPDQPSLTSQVC